MKAFLTSFITMQSACRQYPVYSEAPVSLTLHGPQSYCYLEGIQDPSLKDILAKVGSEFEKKINAKFFNVHHTFTFTQTVAGNEDCGKQAEEIFNVAKMAINEQTKGKLKLDLADVPQLIVGKVEDNDSIKPLRAYELGIALSEKAVKVAKKAGLIFEEYFTPLPRAVDLGVGQFSSDI